jgi:hypothetical protein
MLDPNSPATRRIFVTFALTAMVVLLWLLTHRYSLFVHDGQLYAFEALAKLNPALKRDLFLAYQSQDHFTVFPTLYATAILAFGLPKAAMTLTVACTVWFLAAVWQLGRDISDSECAWLTVSLFVITAGAYGAFGVFHYSETFLTARAPAEAMIATAVALYFKQRRRSAVLVAFAAMFVHPLMALPGLLLIVCLMLPLQLVVAGAVLGVGAAAALSLVATHVEAASHVIAVVDGTWLEVVRQRSQFLFLQLWRPLDWQLNFRPFVCLVLSAFILEDGRLRKLSILAAIIGATGLALATVASCLGCVAILLQGQAWRWVWITDFVSVMLAVPTALRAWRYGKLGPLCALLLIFGWTYAVLNPLASACGALLVWLLRDAVTAHLTVFVRWSTWAAALMILAWIAANSFTILHTVSLEAGRNPLPIQWARNILGLGLPAALFAWLIVQVLRWRRSLWIPATLCGALTTAAVAACPYTFKQMSSSGTAQEIANLADWRAIIPPASNVVVADGRNGGGFVWFSLQRNNYLTTSQSAGVVFSRDTAMEVERRSNVLLPIEDPDWKILSALDAAHQSGSVRRPAMPEKPLTPQSLRQICADPALDFVVSKEDVGFQPRRHLQRDIWHDWNLYDCRVVRAQALSS